MKHLLVVAENLKMDSSHSRVVTIVLSPEVDPDLTRIIQILPEHLVHAVLEARRPLRTLSST